MRKHRQLACAATLVAALAMAAPAQAAPPVDTTALREAVTVDGMTEHQAALSRPSRTPTPKKKECRPAPPTPVMRQNGRLRDRHE